MAINVSFLQELLGTIADQGRQLLPRALGGGEPEDMVALARALVSGRGEASGVALARAILERYRGASSDERRLFYRLLATEMEPNGERARRAAERFLVESTEAALDDLRAAIESPRQEFFRRLNLAPGATAEIVSLRRDLLRQPNPEPGFAAVDADLRHLLGSWFNRGFLVLRRIDWQTPASILEKIIAYEAVHAIRSWDDLRRRLDPKDRRCYAFFHPSLVDEPLIFVEVALTTEIPGRIRAVLEESRKEGHAVPAPTTAVFYSISNCQEGLRGISFGSFLIKQVAEDLARELPSSNTFVTLSPVPSFARWLDRLMADDGTGVLSDADRDTLHLLRDPGWHEEPVLAQRLEPVLTALAAHYFVRAKSADNRPVDPVARFHLGNGARLERINWLGDLSEKGLGEAHGLMVNYLYNLTEIEKNHEAFANDGVVAISRAVRNALRPEAKSKTAAAKESGAATRLLALPRRVRAKVEGDAPSTNADTPLPLPAPEKAQRDTRS
jgi:malonyl-CoA decarboxylase